MSEVDFLRDRFKCMDEANLDIAYTAMLEVRGYFGVQGQSYCGFVEKLTDRGVSLHSRLKGAICQFDNPGKETITPFDMSRQLMGISGQTFTGLLEQSGLVPAAQVKAARGSKRKPAKPVTRAQPSDFGRAVKEASSTFFGNLIPSGTEKQIKHKVTWWLVGAGLAAALYMVRDPLMKTIEEKLFLSRYGKTPVARTYTPVKSEP